MGVLHRVLTSSCFYMAYKTPLISPRFDLIMSLIGGTTINAAVFILPSVFHFKLAKKDKWWNLKV